MRRNWAGGLIKVALVVCGLAVVAGAMARLPSPGRESGNWDYVDASGNVIGSGYMDCDGQIINFGSSAGRFANIQIYHCP